MTASGEIDVIPGEKFVADKTSYNLWIGEKGGQPHSAKHYDIILKDKGEHWDEFLTRLLRQIQNKESQPMPDQPPPATAQCVKIVEDAVVLYRDEYRKPEKGDLYEVLSEGIHQAKEDLPFATAIFGRIPAADVVAIELPAGVDAARVRGVVVDNGSAVIHRNSFYIYQGVLCKSDFERSASGCDPVDFLPVAREKKRPSKKYSVRNVREIYDTETNRTLLVADEALGEIAGNKWAIVAADALNGAAGRE